MTIHQVVPTTVGAYAVPLVPRFEIAVVQMGISDAPKATRLAHVTTLLEQTRGAKLVVLPELWGVGYFAFDRYVADSEPLEGPTVQCMRQHAMANDAYVLAGSFVERREANLHNTSVLVAPSGDIVATYRKMHLFGFGSDERTLLRPGDDVVAAQTDIGTCGLATCFDLRFPELFRRLLDGGAGMFLVVSAWPHPRLEHWRLFTQVRALENQAFLVAANCVGTNGGRQLCGHSTVIDPTGKRLCEGGETEEVLRVAIDLTEVAQARENFPSVSSRVLR